MTEYISFRKLEPAYLFWLVGYWRLLLIHMEGFFQLLAKEIKELKEQYFSSREIR